MLFVIIGQAIDHDVTLTPEMNLCKAECPSEMEIDCCEFVGHAETPKSCMPILVPEDDAFHNGHIGNKRVRCLDFKKSQPFGCNYSNVDDLQREQFNVLTSFVDGSHVYGSTPEKAQELRAFKDGLLRAEIGLMPFEKSHCPNETRAHKSFLAGDIRANENPALQSIHAVWLREHNRLAKAIKAKNDKLTDEEIFQEARRFLVAEWQYIVYSEWLPVLLGPDLMSRYDLYVNSTSQYDHKVSPNVLSGFSTAAFRFGHTLVSSSIAFMSRDLHQEQKPLRENFFNTEFMLNGEMTHLVRGLCMQNAEKPNGIISEELRNFLFKEKKHDFGSDLAARNIQRGRDHQIGTYDNYRQVCGLSPLPGTFFSSPPPELDRTTWTKMTRIYNSPSEIELFPGGMSELPVPGGVVGSTFGCIIAEQFSRIKKGDRYFFTHENVDRNLRFCDADLTAIKSRRMFDIICDNADVDEAPENPFFGLKDKPLLSCVNRNPLEPTPLCLADSNDFDEFVEAKDLHDEDEKQVAVLAGGYDGWNVLSSVEVFSPSGTCQHSLAPLPAPTYGLFLAYHEGLLMACGGRKIGRPDEDAKICWRYERDGEDGKWVEEPGLRLNERRLMAPAEKDLNTGRIYVTGGRLSPRTTEYFDPNTHRWVPGPTLPQSRIQHCQLMLKDKILFLGGIQASSNIVDSINMITSEWDKKTEPYAFRYKHACVVLPDNDTVLVVGGGLNSNLYQISTGRSVWWKPTIFSRNHGSVLKLNGRYLFFGDDRHRDVVEEYDVSAQRFKLLKTATTKEGRTRFGITKVPAEFFKHLPGGCEP